RNWNTSRRSTLTPTRFNGAAPSRARNWSSRSFTWVSASLLQRGRALAGAEFLSILHHPTGPASFASTGPRPRGRGIKRLTRGHQCKYLRFNGAAPSRAGNLNRPEFVGTRILKLQRGRALAGAELAALLPIVVQDRNRSIATASASSIAFV